jgi:sulfate transport system permease protein
MGASGNRGKARVIPGFGLSMGITVSMVSLIVIVPMLSIFVSLSGMSLGDLWEAATDAKVMAAYSVSLSASFIAAAINAVFGVILAWCLVRYKFPGRRLLDGFIELPFALPTAVAGIALTALCRPDGWIGRMFIGFGIDIAYTRIGITVALIFIGIPFVVRSVQPVLEKLGPECEEAAQMLGAGKTRTFFKVIFPEILPAALTGFGLAFARGLGEYGSVIFIAGNIPYKTQIVPLLIMSKLEQFNYGDAAAIALVMILFSFFILFALNIVQSKISRAEKG